MDFWKTKTEEEKQAFAESKGFRDFAHWLEFQQYDEVFTENEDFEP